MKKLFRVILVSFVILFILWIFYFLYFENGLSQIGQFLPLVWPVLTSLLFLSTILKIPIGISSKNWPFTEGKIITSEIIRVTGGESGDSYKANINYSFVVNGKTYKSSSISTAPRWWYWGNLKSVAEKRVSKYPKNLILDVYYNSQSPEKSFLEPGIHFLSILIGGLIFISTNVLFIIVMNLVL